MELSSHDTDHVPEAESATCAVPPPREDVAAWRELAVAALLAVASFLLRLALDPWLRDEHAYTPAFAAVAIAGWLGSWRAGVLCAVLSFGLSNYFFVEPRDAYAFSLKEVVGAGAFFFLSAVLLALAHRARRASERTRELLQRLRRADAAKAESLAVFAHELRNPLAAMSNAAQLLQSDAGPAARERAVAILSRQVAQVTRMTTDLMDAARIGQGKVTLARVQAPLVDLVATALESLQPALQARHQQVAVDVPAALTAWVDPARIVQVFSNLLHNASKFSPAGSSMEVQARAEADSVRIRFTDHGRGIPPDKLDWVFDTYAQVGHAADGLGLGLSLVRKLVVLHGGSIAR